MPKTEAACQNDTVLMTYSLHFKSLM